MQSVVIPGSGHWVAEQAPELMLAALSTFLEPYGAAAAYAQAPRTAQGPGDVVVADQATATLRALAIGLG